MSMGRFKYSFSQARKNIWRNGLMSLASLFTIASCLIILGIFTMLTMNVNHITAEIKNQCEIEFFMKDDANEQTVARIGEQIRAMENVKEAVLFTKADRLDYAKKDAFEGREELLEGYEKDNPFSDSYKITLKDISKTSETVSQMEAIDGVDHINNQQDFVDLVLAFSNMIKKCSIVIMAVLLIVAIVIISNAIKLTVFNRRKEINIMKYIGATDGFIRVPFIIEGMLIGLLGAVLAFALSSWGYVALSGYMDKLQMDLFTLLPYYETAPVMAVIFIFAGCVIGMVGSLISMRKYLRV